MFAQKRVKVEGSFNTAALPPGFGSTAAAAAPPPLFKKKKKTKVQEEAEAAVRKWTPEKRKRIRTLVQRLLKLDDFQQDLFTSTDLAEILNIKSRKQVRRDEEEAANSTVKQKVVPQRVKYPYLGLAAHGPVKASKAFKLALRTQNVPIPDPQRDELRVFYQGCSYMYDRRLGTCLEVSTLLDDAQATPVLVRLHGFQPYFYIKKPDDWDMEDVERLREVLSENLRVVAQKDYESSDRNCNKEFVKIKELFQKKGLSWQMYSSGSYNLGPYGASAEERNAELTVDDVQLIRKYQFLLEFRLQMAAVLSTHVDLVTKATLVDAQDLHWYKPPEETETFVRLQVTHPSLVRKARSLLENPHGKRGVVGWEIPPWFKSSLMNGHKLPRVQYIAPHGDVVDTEGFDIFEADVDFVIRHLVDKDIAPCSWFSLAAGSGYRVVPKSDHSRQSNCALEIVAHADTFLPVKDPAYATKIPDLVKCFTDIECITNGKKFPRSDQDPVICVGINSNRLHSKGKYIQYLFALKSVSDVPTADHIFWYDDERELLAELLFFIVHILDPDVIGHHNGNGFDLPYLINRAMCLGLADFNLMGRSLTKRLHLYQQENKGRLKHYVNIEGRINFDLMRRAMDDFSSRFSNFSLNEVAEKTIGMTKAEMPYELLAYHFATEHGRRLEAVYVLLDAYLPHACADKLNAIMSSMMMARLCCIPWQVAMDRSQNSKAEGRFRHMMCPGGRVSRLKRTLKKGNIISKNRQAEAAMMEKHGAKSKDDEGEVGYTGAIVITPRRGYYGELKEREGDTTASTEGVAEDDWAGWFDSEEEREEEAREEQVYNPMETADQRAGIPDDFDVGSLDREGIKQMADRMAREEMEEAGEGGSGVGTKPTPEPDQIAEALKRNGIQGAEHWHMPQLNRTQRRQLFLYMRRRWSRILRFCKRMGVKLHGRYTATGDFASMYPGIMRAHNMCYTTAVHHDTIKKYSLVEGRDYGFTPETLVIYDAKLDKRRVISIPSPKNPAFVYPHVLKGLLPAIQEEMATERSRVKKQMEGVLKVVEAMRLKRKNTPAAFTPGDAVQLAALEFEYDTLNIIQETTKLFMNGLYGITGDATSSWYMISIASAVTTHGRNMITRVRIRMEDDFGPEHGDPFYIMVIYGDTDSCMANFIGPIHSAAEACTHGKRVVDEVNKREAFIFPQKLEFEKIYEGMTLGDKKRYIALKYLFAEAAPRIDLRGMTHKRKTPPPFVRETLNQLSDLLYAKRDIWAAMDLLRKRLRQLMANDMPINQLFERVQLTKDPSEYGASKEVTKSKSKKELKRIDELKGQKRIFDFCAVSAQGRESMVEEDTLNEQTHVVKMQQAPIPAAVVVARRINEQCPDNPRTAGSIIHLLVAENEDKSITNKGMRCLEPLEAIEQNAKPDIQYYLKSLMAPLGTLFYFPMIAAGLIEPEHAVWSRSLQPVSTYLKTWEEAEKEFSERYKEASDHADVFMEDERFVNLPRIKNDVRAKRVCDVLYNEVRRKRFRPDIKRTAGMDQYAQEFLRCETCALPMLTEGAYDESTRAVAGASAQMRSELAPNICQSCEQNELLDYRARQVTDLWQQRTESTTGKEIEPERVRKFYQRSMSVLRDRLADHKMSKQETQVIEQLYYDKVEASVERLNTHSKRAQELGKKCHDCLHGDEEGIMQCQAFACGTFGERFLVRTHISDELKTLCTQYAVQVKDLEW